MAKQKIEHGLGRGLNALLGDRRFDDLVQVTGLFERVTITFNAFFGDMKWVDILAVFGLEGAYLTELFGTKTIGTPDAGATSMACFFRGLAQA